MLQNMFLKVIVILKVLMDLGNNNLQVKFGILLKNLDTIQNCMLLKLSILMNIIKFKFDLSK